MIDRFLILCYFVWVIILIGCYDVFFWVYFEAICLRGFNYLILIIIINLIVVTISKHDLMARLFIVLSWRVIIITLLTKVIATIITTTRRSLIIILLIPLILTILTINSTPYPDQYSSSSYPITSLCRYPLLSLIALYLINKTVSMM